MISREVLSAFSDEMQKQALLGTILRMPIARRLATAAMEKSPETLRLKRLRKALVKGDKTEVTILPADDSVGPRYEPRAKQWVGVRKEEDPAILAHELGHAELDRELVGSVLQSKPVRIGAALGSITGIAVARHGPVAIGAAISAAALLPIPIYEGMASLRGLERLRRVGATDEELADARSKLLKAWGTYALLPAGAAVDAASLGMLSRLGRD